MYNWLSRLATFTKQGSRRLFYHGTSNVNLKSILSEGLNNHHKTLFDSDFAPDKMHSIESYGGIYFTNNLMTALASAGQGNRKYIGQYGADDVIVIVELETKSPHILIDEDKIPSITYAIQDIFKDISPNGYWWASWADGGFDQIDNIADAFLKHLTSRFNIPANQQRFLAHLKQYVFPMIKGYAMREAALLIEASKKGYTWTSIGNTFPNFAHLTVADAENQYRNAANIFTQKAHRLTEFMSQAHNEMWINVRSLTPVTFGGVNYIVAIFLTHDNRDYFEYTGQPRGYHSEIIMKYGTNNQNTLMSAISMLINDYTKSIGEFFVLKDVKGRTYYDNPNMSIAENNNNETS